MINVSWIRPDQFEAMEREWNALLENSPVNNVFLTWDYLHTWWTHFRSSQRKLISIAGHRNGDLVGIAPLYLSADKPSSVEIRLLGYGEKVCPDYLDFIVRSDVDGRTVRKSFLQFLLRQPGWDRLHLTDIVQDQDLDAALSDLNGQLDYIKEVGTTCSYLTLPSTWNEFLQGLSRKMRSNVKRRSKALLGQHKVTLHQVESEKDIRPTLNRLKTLHTKRWSMLGRPSRYQDPQYFEFHCKVCRNLLKKGYTLLSELRRDREALAILYCYLYDKKIYYYGGSFDSSSEMARFSPGNTLRALLIRYGIELGCTEFDFLRGRDVYKNDWCNGSRNTYEYFVVRRGLRGTWVNRDVYIKQVKRAIKYALSKHCRKKQ